MASNPLEIQTPSQIADRYLANLKVMRPGINTDQEDSEYWVRSRTVGGTVAGAHADVRKVSNDAFPQSARHEALEQHLILYFGAGFNPATQSQGFVGVTGSIGASIITGQVLQHQATGYEFKVTSDFTFVAASGALAVQSVLTGQEQDLSAGAELSFNPPVASVNTIGVILPASSSNLTEGLTDARNAESDDEAVARILTRVRNKLRGGARADYEQWAIDADPSVVSANVLRFPFGLGTVQVVITAGTTDIDNAIDTGTPISLTPSLALLGTVLTYVRGLDPLTDCISVSGPNPIGVDVTVRARFVSGTVATVIPGLGITQGQAVEREIQRAIYKTKVGGYKIGNSGYVMKSHMEDTIDTNLSANGISVGLKQQILIDREIDDLAASGPNLLILGNQLPLPDTITVLDMT